MDQGRGMRRSGKLAWKATIFDQQDPKGKGFGYDVVCESKRDKNQFRSVAKWD